MKKVLLIIGSIIAVLAAALLMWKVVFPFIGWVLSGIFGVLGFSFDSIIDFFKSFLN